MKKPFVATGTKGPSAVPPCLPSIWLGRLCRANGRSPPPTTVFHRRSLARVSQLEPVGEFGLSALRRHHAGSHEFRFAGGWPTTPTSALDAFGPQQAES